MNYVFYSLRAINGQSLLTKNRDSRYLYFIFAFYKDASDREVSSGSGFGSGSGSG